MENKKSDWAPNGCSGGLSKTWKFFTGHPPPFEECCNRHDYAYYIGGTERRRLAADRKLRICIANMGYKKWSIIVYLVVRFFGNTHFIFKRKRHYWGYGKRNVMKSIYNR